MKVLHVNTHVNIGGIGQYILSLTKVLKGRDVECIVASSGGDLEGEFKASGIAHRYLNIKTKSELNPKVFGAAFALNDIIRAEKIELIHAHTRVSQVAVFFASYMSGIPYVSTCHGYFKPRLFRKKFDTWGKKVVAISDAVRAHLETDFGIDRERIALIYTGIDIDKFSKTYSPEEIVAAKKSLGFKDAPVIGTIGRLSSVKGQRFLIEGMKYAAAKNPLAQCLIVGSGPEEYALKELAISSGLKDKIKFIGSNYSDMPRILSAIDVFVLPSIKEGLGLALLEAMSAAKPCIGSDIGGISDIIQDGVNGLLAPVGNGKLIGEAVLRLLDDKILSEKIALAGRELVREKFPISLMGDKMVKLYQEVIYENK